EAGVDRRDVRIDGVEDERDPRREERLGRRAQPFRRALGEVPVDGRDVDAALGVNGPVLDDPREAAPAARPLPRVARKGGAAVDALDLVADSGLERFAEPVHSLAEEDVGAGLLAETPDAGFVVEGHGAVLSVRWSRSPP